MNLRTIGAAILGATLATFAAAASPIPSTTATTAYHRAQVDGVGVSIERRDQTTHRPSYCCTGSPRLRGDTIC